METWFSQPSELLPTPLFLLEGQRKARRPPALCVEEPAVRPASKKPRGAPLRPEPYLPPDRALQVDGGTPLRHARCAFGKRVLAIPQQVRDFDAGLDDAEGELLLVELTAPDGAWLEDPEVSGVLVRLSPPMFVPILAVRRLVQARVNLFGKPVSQLKKLYQLVRPLCAPEYALTLVSMSDLPPPESVDAACPRA